MEELTYQLIIGYKHQPGKYHRSERTNDRSKLADFVSAIFRQYGAFNYEATEFIYEKCGDKYMLVHTRRL